MKVALCRTCIAYTANDETPGYGTCTVSGVFSMRVCARLHRLAVLQNLEALTMKRYCVTAINRLTGERQIITPPCSRGDADAIRARLMGIKPGKRSYTNPLTVEYPKQLNLFTKTLDV